MTMLMTTIDDASFNPSGRDAAIAGLAKLCAELAGVLRRETGRLREMKTGGIKDMQSEKASLAALYDDRARSVMEDLEGLKSAPAPLRDRLRNALQDLHGAMAENERALLATRAANERVIQTVIDTVASRTSAIPVYGKDGAPRDASRSTARGERPRLSLSVDQRL